MPEERIFEKSRAQLVNLEEFIPNILVDLKYGTIDNVAGKVLYENPVPQLRRETAEKLKEASKIFNEMGYKVKVWDGYRPSSVQQELWDSVDEKSRIYFMNPKLGSNHTRGCAVDVTLTDWNGAELDMPSGFDDITGKATRKYVYATPIQKSNAQMLEKVMRQVGFNIINTEWWHFDDSDYKLYELID
jgi:D-alanyl-D-alanine dipeptidase